MKIRSGFVSNSSSSSFVLVGLKIQVGSPQFEMIKKYLKKENKWTDNEDDEDIDAMIEGLDNLDIEYIRQNDEEFYAGDILATDDEDFMEAIEMEIPTQDNIINSKDNYTSLRYLMKMGIDPTKFRIVVGQDGGY